MLEISGAIYTGCICNTNIFIKFMLCLSYRPYLVRNNVSIFYLLKFIWDTKSGELGIQANSTVLPLQKERYYLRALGKDVRKDRANFSEQFPELAEDLEIPPIFPSNLFFSSVFRISSPGVRLWTHYDVRYEFSST